jgi:hypothetical protein
MVGKMSRSLHNYPSLILNPPFYPLFDSIAARTNICRQELSTAKKAIDDPDLDLFLEDMTLK